MKLPSLLALTAALTCGLWASNASAQIFTAIDFDGVPSGSLASAFETPQLSFHQAKLAPDLDLWGDPVGSPYWQVDADSDLLYPLTVEDPTDYGRGPAPSGTNALQALWQPVLLRFDRAYRVASFSVTLDNDTFGFPDQISFLQGHELVRSLLVDLSVPSLIASADEIPEVTGIVLPAGAFYDDLRLTLVPVPEPSTYALAGAAALFFAVAARRFRRGKVAATRA